MFDNMPVPDNVQLLKEEALKNGRSVEYSCAAVGNLHCPAWRVIVKGETLPISQHSRLSHEFNSGRCV